MLLVQTLGKLGQTLVVLFIVSVATFGLLKLATGGIGQHPSSYLYPSRGRPGGMGTTSPEHRLEEAFERIEETILPCISMMLDTLLDASAGLEEADPKVLVAELQILAAELEELIQAVERSSPAKMDPGPYRASNVA